VDDGRPTGFGRLAFQSPAKAHLSVTSKRGNSANFMDKLTFATNHSVEPVKTVRTILILMNQ
jgi:hypothetical protein